MVHVVIPVHTVATDEIQIGDSVQPVAQLGETGVRSEVCGICFCYAEYNFITNIFTVDHPYFLQLSDGKVGKGSIRHTPELIPLVDKIFHTEPDLAAIVHQIGTPVVEYLQSSDFHVGFLNINPVIENDSVFPDRCVHFLAAQFQLIEKQTNRHEITVAQAVCNGTNLLGNRADHFGNQLLNRSCREYDVCLLRACDAGLTVPDLQMSNRSSIQSQPDNLLLAQDSNTSLSGF